MKLEGKYKLIKLGGSLAMTIPTQWAEEANLKQGDYVYRKIDGNSIIVTILWKSSKERKMAEIDDK